MINAKSDETSIIKVCRELQYQAHEHTYEPTHD